MKIQQTYIVNACFMEIMAEYNNFNDREKLELVELLDKFSSTDPTNVYKFAKTLKAFEDKFIKYNGDYDKLEAAIKQIRDNAYMAAAKQIPGIKLIKTGDANEL